MSSEFGNRVRVSVFGQSHGEGIGVVVNGFPSGEKIDFEELMGFMDRRRGGKNALSTKRSEPDIPKFISGVIDGATCGSPLCAVLKNSDTRSGDYAGLTDTPRPGHADFTAKIKWEGTADMRGGGHFSGRLTAPVCVAGGIAKQILARRGIYVGAHLSEVYGIKDDAFPLYPTAELFESVAKKPFPVLNDEAGEKMKAAVLEAAGEADSVGGVIECCIIGQPAGLGAPMFDGVENKIAAAVFGIPAVKGLEFGSGFEGSRKKGSENNDPFVIENGRVVTAANNAGGILGGITNAMPIVFRAAIKPTPSIGKKQRTVSVSKMENTELNVKGRHDPCIAQRAVPVVEAVAALVMLDMLLEGK